MEDWRCNWSPQVFIKARWGENRLSLEKSLSGRLEKWASLRDWDGRLGCVKIQTVLQKSPKSLWD